MQRSNWLSLPGEIVKELMRPAPRMIHHIASRIQIQPQALDGCQRTASPMLPRWMNRMALVRCVVTVGPRRRRYGEDLLREPPSAMRAVSISSLATLLGPPISKGQARSQQQKRRVGNEATHHLQARIAILNHLLCHIVRPSIHQAPVQEAAAATVPVEQTVAMDVQRTTTASLRRRT